MAQVLIRNVDDNIIDNLKARAKRNGVSIYLALAARMGLPYVTADERFINGVQSSRLAQCVSGWVTFEI